MLRNYLQIAKRLLLNNLLYFLVNLIGLSLGIACCIIAYFNWEFHQQWDGGHLNEERIFKVNTVRNLENNLYTYGISPVPLAENARIASSSIEKIAQINMRKEVLKLDQKAINQQVGYIDPDFINIFSFDVSKGNASLLQNTGQVIITEETAIQYYGNSQCVGRPLTLVTQEGENIQLSIAAILQDHPLNSSFHFDVLLNEELFNRIYNIDEEDWSVFSHATFLLLDDKSSAAKVEQQLNSFIEPLNESKEDWDAVNYSLVNLAKMSRDARYIRSNYLGQNNPEGAVMIPNIMAVLILLVACINFMNTSISLSGKRLKEIGVRKAIGARRNQLIAQLLSENFFILAIALILGIFLAEFLIPFYSQLGPWIDLTITYSGNLAFFGFLIGLLVLTALLSGAYPAFYVSKFNTANIFSGNFRLKGSGVLAKSLMVIQLGFSLIALIQGIVYVQTTIVQKNYDLGYNKSGIITIPIKDQTRFQLFEQEAMNHSLVNSVSGSIHHIGYSNTGEYTETEQVKKDARVFEVGHNYAKTMGIEVIEGRGFNKDSESDRKEAVIVSERFVDQFKLSDPIDQRIMMDDVPYRIIGVVKDFYPYGLWKDETKFPIALKLANEEDFRFIVSQVNGDIERADKELEVIWKQIYPDTPYESDRENIHVFRSELLSNNMAVLNIFLAATALFLSATGLFTLISISIQKRRKEIGLRRIMGASVLHVVGLINRGYIYLVGAALILGTILGAFLTDMFLELMFSVYAQVGWISIGITTAMVVFIVIATSGYKVFRAASDPPIEALRYE